MNKSMIATVEAQTREGARRAQPSERDIATRAFEIFEKRGGTHGNDVGDWFQAERELRMAEGKGQKP